ncbi:MAG: DUF4147 domain-containing protein [Acidobacteriia bacterium]|nr:DUF4147 domain-containing protein [Terriglobia bacterium]
MGRTASAGSSSQATPHMRETAREIFLDALDRSSIAKAFDRHVSYSRGVLQVAEDLYNIGTYSRVFVVAFGKAAHTMVEALAGQMGGSVGGIVACPEAPPAKVFGFRYFQGGHPVPNEESILGANAVLRSLHGATARWLVLYLISGGGSAVIEKPIDADIGLEDLVATYRELVLCGAPIAEINAIRKHLSAVKGGRLAQAAREAQQVSILVSDVPPAALDSLASGPTMGDSTTVEDCYAIVRKYGLLSRFPPSVRDLFQTRALEETPKPGDPLFHRSRWWPILSSATAQKAAADKAALSGFTVEEDNTCDDWDYAKAADHLLKRLQELRKGASRVCLISAGEVTVKVSQPAGTGGRNQQFALYCAEKIAGQNICVLSAGTDGVDGNSRAAGAVVDGTTVARARATGLDVERALKEFDAYPLFEKLGDAIVTGPTGNNVRDLRILLAD